MKRQKRKNIVQTRKALGLACVFDNIELKFWWANKCLLQLSQYESPPNVLDFEKATSNHFDLINRLNDFQNNPNEFSNLINSYFIIPWGGGPYFNSHEDACLKIKNEYLKSKSELTNFINTYSQPPVSRINDFISFLNLNKNEVEILYFGLMNAYTHGSGFTLSLLNEDDLFNKISLITYLPIIEIKKCLLPSSSLLKERVFTVINNEIHFNLEWDEFFFDGQLSIRKSLLNLNKTSFEDLRLLKKVGYGDSVSLTELPYRHFLKIKSIKELYSYPQKKFFNVEFAYEESDVFHPFEVILNKLNARHDFRDIEYEISPTDSSKIIKGKLSIFYSDRVFLRVLDELKIHYPDYFNSQISPFFPGY